MKKEHKISIFLIGFYTDILKKEWNVYGCNRICNTMYITLVKESNWPLYRSSPNNYKTYKFILREI